ncbi:YdcF family protein [Parasulfitobacter algicola]|uniref:YdcF family protein n=1 Tax=Parasulfitobacter algicola TaxID=2614809 RepID=A0ABX2IX71_9RHOB|nr:YdcF family protein [Sulfitobacter algicola]NSX55795.1 YdcF family protein [Sulfitobacter algicola]
MIRRIKRLILWCAIIFTSTCIFIWIFAHLQAAFEPDPFATADVIVVLGAGMSADGTLHSSTKGRIEKAVQLYQTGVAPKMHMTGGRAVPDGPSAGDQMADYAIQLGVPRYAITAEDASLSTLQNALFSAPYLMSADRLILVTEGFHLPRAYLSFAWATDADIALAHSSKFRTGSSVKLIIREAAAWWFNLGRLGLWYIAGVTTPENRDTILQ